jgi:hypothetical protein
MSQRLIAAVIALVFLLLNNEHVQSQTGVFYYQNSNDIYINSKGIKVHTLPNGNLLLLNRCSDKDYKVHATQLIEVDLSGKKISEHIFETENLYDIVDIIDFQPPKCFIYGNLYLNKLFIPLTITLDAANYSISQQNESVIYSTSVVDIMPVENDKLFMLLTKSGKNELYNITLNKIDLSTMKVEWFKKISSEQNEEADDLEVGTDGTINILGKKYNDNVTEYVPILYKLDKEGNLVWKKGVDIPASFNTQNFSLNNQGEIFYACGYVKTQTGMSETRLLKYSKEGDLISSVNLNEFSANGIIRLSSQKLLLYGSRFFVNTKQVVTKGAYIILDENLVELTNRSLSVNDKPDKDFHYKGTSSSDLQTAKELPDGRIVLLGKVYLPVLGGNESTKQNNPLLIITDKDGNY